MVFGDANFTFATKLAKQRKALGPVGRAVATTFEQIETLKARYPDIESNLIVKDANRERMTQIMIETFQSIMKCDVV